VAADDGSAEPETQAVFGKSHLCKLNAGGFLPTIRTSSSPSGVASGAQGVAFNLLGPAFSGAVVACVGGAIPGSTETPKGRSGGESG